MSELIPKSAEIPDSDYVIIGGTGDLALRKIFPALFWRYLAGQITTEFRLIVAARSSISVDEFAGKLRPFCADAIADAITIAAWKDIYDGKVEDQEKLIEYVLPKNGNWKIVDC